MFENKRLVQRIFDKDCDTYVQSACALIEIDEMLTKISETKCQNWACSAFQHSQKKIGQKGKMHLTKSEAWLMRDGDTHTHTHKHALTKAKLFCLNLQANAYESQSWCQFSLKQNHHTEKERHYLICIKLETRTWLIRNRQRNHSERKKQKNYLTNKKEGSENTLLYHVEMLKSEPIKYNYSTI